MVLWLLQCLWCFGCWCDIENVDGAVAVDVPEVLWLLVWCCECWCGAVIALVPAVLWLLV